MPDYEESGPVAASPDVVFAFLSDVSHMPDYIPDMVLARTEGDRLRVAAEVSGRHEEGNAWLRADPDQHRLDWGGEAAGYSGWLKVSASEPGSQVTIHLSTDRISDETAIHDSLVQALANIRDKIADQ